MVTVIASCKQEDENPEGGCGLAGCLPVELPGEFETGMRLSYTADNRLDTVSYIDSEGKAQWAAKMNYDDQCQLTLIDFYDPHHQNKMSFRMTYQDSLITRSFYILEDNGSETFYDSARYILSDQKIESVYHYSATGQFNSTTHFEYDASGNIIRSIQTGGQSPIVIESAYEYDEHENPYKKVNVNWFILEVYDISNLSTNNVTKITTLGSFEDSVEEFTYTYNSAGLPLTVSTPTQPVKTFKYINCE